MTLFKKQQKGKGSQEKLSPKKLSPKKLFLAFLSLFIGSLTFLMTTGALDMPDVLMSYATADLTNKNVVEDHPTDLESAPLPSLFWRYTAYEQELLLDVQNMVMTGFFPEGK